MSISLAVSCDSDSELSQSAAASELYRLVGVVDAFKAKSVNVFEGPVKIILFKVCFIFLLRFLRVFSVPGCSGLLRKGIHCFWN